MAKETRVAAFTLGTHEDRFQELQRQIEDLDNQGRRHNLRIQGLPESIPSGQVEAAVVEVFNGLLERPPDSPISLERCHRALRPAEIHRLRHEMSSALWTTSN